MDDAPVEREEIHTRTIEMKGFRRADGLFEVEGTVIDTKPYDYRPRTADYEVPKGQRIHDITLTLVLDERLEVLDVRTRMASTPYDICPAAGAAMRALIGMRIGPGWNSEARRRLVTADRCTHLAELLAPMATTAIQAITGLRADQPEAVDAQGRPLKIDSCYAYSAERALVRRRWPQFHTG